MPGNKAGGLLAKEKNLARDPDWYKKIGKLGGKAGNTGGFASNMVGQDGLTGKQRASVAGTLGGRVSRRRPKSANV